MFYDDLVQILQSCDIPDSVKICAESRLREDLLMSSFAMMVLMVKLESFLHMEIDPAILEQSITVNDLLSAIHAYISVMKDAQEVQ